MMRRIRFLRFSFAGFRPDFGPRSTVERLQHAAAGPAGLLWWAPGPEKVPHVVVSDYML